MDKYHPENDFSMKIEVSCQLLQSPFSKNTTLSVFGQNTWLLNLITAVHSERTRELIEFDKKTILILIAILRGYCAIGSFAGMFSLSYLDYSRNWHDVVETESVEHLFASVLHFIGSWVTERYKIWLWW